MGELKFFPCDTNWDREMKLFKAKFKLEGVGFMLELWKTIYRNGYYYPWDEETKLLFSDEHNISIEKIDTFINYALEKNLISRPVFEKYQVLTSHGIQHRYMEIHIKSKWTRVEFIEEYLLIDVRNYVIPKGLQITYIKLIKSSEEMSKSSEEIPNFQEEIPNFQPKIPNQFGIDSEFLPQSKAKQIKANEIKEKQQQCGILSDNPNSPDNFQEEKSAAALFNLKKYFKEQKHYILEYDDQTLNAFIARMQENELDNTFLDFVIMKMQAKDKIKPIASPWGFFKKAFLEYDDLVNEWQNINNDPKKKSREDPPQKCECGSTNFEIYEKDIGKAHGLPREIFCTDCGLRFRYDYSTNTWIKQKECVILDPDIPNWVESLK